MRIASWFRGILLPNAAGVDELRRTVQRMKELIANHPRSAYFSTWEAIRALENREPEMALGFLQEAYFEYVDEHVFSDDESRVAMREMIRQAASAAKIENVLSDTD